MEETKKYWWMCIAQGVDMYEKGKLTLTEVVTDIHPFTYMNNIPENIYEKTSNKTGCYLSNWKNIDVEEYNLFNTINNI